MLNKTHARVAVISFELISSECLWSGRVHNMMKFMFEHVRTYGNAGLGRCFFFSLLSSLCAYVVVQPETADAEITARHFWAVSVVCPSSPFARSRSRARSFVCVLLSMGAVCGSGCTTDYHKKWARQTTRHPLVLYYYEHIHTNWIFIIKYIHWMTRSHWNFILGRRSVGRSVGPLSTGRSQQQ